VPVLGAVLQELLHAYTPYLGILQYLFFTSSQDEKGLPGDCRLRRVKFSIM
jgi:hypothetical protein